jgi:uncharacterized membrane protein YedE/YeeE
MMRILIAFVCGALMSAGIAVSQMIDPNKVLAFLDVAGNWDPSLALVMAGALAVFSLGFYTLGQRRQPVCESTFHAPTKTALDRPLVVGATLFGLGWGLVGYCPGPAVAALPSASPGTLGFVAAMVVGWWLSRRFKLS